MAEALFLVRKHADGGDRVINGVTHVLINKDDAQTAAQIRAAAIAKLNGVFGANTIPADYFNDGPTPEKVSDLTAGPLKDDEDVYFWSVVGDSFFHAAN